MNLTMAYELDIEFMNWINFWESWRTLASEKPPLKHLIEYIKWYFSEPKYRKETDK